MSPRTAILQSSAMRHDGSHCDVVVLQKNSRGSGQSSSVNQPPPPPPEPPPVPQLIFAGSHGGLLQPIRLSAASAAARKPNRTRRMRNSLGRSFWDDRCKKAAHLT